MRISLVIAAVSAIALSGCCCSQRCSPCSPSGPAAPAPKAKAKPCVARYVPPAFSPATAPKWTPAPSLAANPVRLAFPVAYPTTSSYAASWNRSARLAVASTPAPVAARPSAPAAAYVPATLARPPIGTWRSTAPAAIQAIIVPPAASSANGAAHGEDCEECPGGVCGVPPPR